MELANAGDARLGKVRPRDDVAPQDGLLQPRRCNHRRLRLGERLEELAAREKGGLARRGGGGGAQRSLLPGGDAPARGGVAGSSSGTAQAAQAARDAAEDDAFDEVLDLLGGLVNSNPSLDDPAQAR